MNRVQREERMQRIRIGLTGLAFVFLLVLLGTAISRSSGDPVSPPAQNELRRARRAVGGNRRGAGHDARK